MRPVDILFPEQAARVRASCCATCALAVNPETDFKDALSRKEWGISGMCQSCQDSVFDNLPEEVEEDPYAQAREDHEDGRVCPCGIPWDISGCPRCL